MKNSWKTRWKDPQRLLLWLGGAGLAGILALISMNAVLTYQRAHQEVESQLLAETRLMAEQTAASLAGTQLILGYVRTLVATRGVEALRDESLVPQMLMRAVAVMPQIDAINVIGADGRLLFSTAAEVDTFPHTFEGRSYFQAHARGTQMLLASAVTSQVTDVYRVPVSVRLVDANGAFAGVAVADLRVEYYVELFSGSWQGADFRAGLVFKDGTLLFLAPYQEDQAGRRLPQLVERTGGNKSGTFDAVSLLDGTKRMFAFHEVQGQPLLMTVSYSHDEFLASRWPQWATSAALALIFTVFTVCSVRLLRRQVRAVEQSRRELREMATTDELSGLPNRRHFKELAQQEFRHAKRAGHGLVVMLVDIDRFKQINDTHGHDIGDEAIRAVAHVMRETLRESDLLCRWGGEEYAALLLHVDAAVAREVAERVRQAVAEHEIRLEDGSSLRVTISAGLASWPPGEARLERLVTQADQALYQAKESGRNRVCVAEPSGDAMEESAVASEGLPLRSSPPAPL